MNEDGIGDGRGERSVSTSLLRNRHPWPVLWWWCYAVHAGVASFRNAPWTKTELAKAGADGGLRRGLSVRSQGQLNPFPPTRGVCAPVFSTHSTQLWRQFWCSRRPRPCALPTNLHNTASDISLHQNDIEIKSTLFETHDFKVVNRTEWEGKVCDIANDCTKNVRQKTGKDTYYHVRSIKVNDWKSFKKKFKWN